MHKNNTLTLYKTICFYQLSNMAQTKAKKAAAKKAPAKKAAAKKAPAKSRGKK